MEKKSKKEIEIPEPTPGHVARNKLDTRADTICAGINFLCIRPTGMSCNVQGFHASFDPILEIPVASVATAWEEPTTGQTYILVIHQALYFGTQLDHSLINPNQIRVTGISVCNDPFDRYRHLGINLDILHIPFQTDGNTIYFTSRVPTKQELEDCQYITLTDDEEWDPSETDLTDYAQKEIKQVKLAKLELDMDEADVIMRQISSVYSERSLSKKVQETVRVTSQLISKTRHSVVSPENVARAWNIGIEKAKDTLRVTTQKGIRYAIHPIHRRY
jgi:hypothetical protein